MFKTLFQIARKGVFPQLATIVWLFAPSVTFGQVEFDWAKIGNPHNAGDVQPQGTFGSVGYTYRISKHEVTNAQYTEFLNAVDPSGLNSLCLFDGEMSTDTGGIEKTGTTDGARYAVKTGRGQNPVTYVDWYDAARFVNWLSNGQSTGSTETGTYTLVGNSCTPNNLDDLSRDFDATYFIPTEDEWYKAAFHDSAAGTARTYFEYPTSNNSPPHSDNPSSLNTPDDTNVANVFRDDFEANGYDDGYAISGTSLGAIPANPFTDVGAYPTTMSPYGVFDLAGNVVEWNETQHGTTSHGLRGGDWSTQYDGALASQREFQNSDFESGAVGFRVANIPELARLRFDGTVSEIATQESFDISIGESVSGELVVRSFGEPFLEEQDSEEYFVDVSGFINVSGVRIDIPFHESLLYIEDSSPNDVDSQDISLFWSFAYQVLDVFNADSLFPEGLDDIVDLLTSNTHDVGIFFVDGTPSGQSVVFNVEIDRFQAVPEPTKTNMLLPLLLLILGYRRSERAKD